MRVVLFYFPGHFCQSQPMMIKYDKTDDDIVLCRTFSNDVQAHIALAALENEGIAATIDNDIFSRIYPLPFSDIGGLRLMVRKRDLDRATAIVDSLDFYDSEA